MNKARGWTAALGAGIVFLACRSAAAKGNPNDLVRTAQERLQDAGFLGAETEMRPVPIAVPAKRQDNVYDVLKKDLIAYKDPQFQGHRFLAVFTGEYSHGLAKEMMQERGDILCRSLGNGPSRFQEPEYWLRGQTVLVMDAQGQISPRVFRMIDTWSRDYYITFKELDCEKKKK